MSGTIAEATISTFGQIEETALNLDAQSLLQWKQGDIRGYNELVKRYEKPLFHFIVRTIRDRDDAKDVLQETFVRLFRSKEKLQENRSLKSWLFTAAHNLCIDFFRKHKPGRVTAVDSQDSAFQSMADSSSIEKPAQPDALYQEKWVQEKIIEAIQTLPPKQQMVMTLRSCKEMSLKEIADVMECSERTVGTTLFAARKKLMKMLKQTLEGQIGEALFATVSE